MFRPQGRERSVVVAVLLLTGCTGPASANTNPDETVREAIGQAASAVEVGILVVELVGEDRTTAAAADTTLHDALLGVWDAQGLLARDIPPDAAAIETRGHASAAADAGATALADARAWVNAIPGSDSDHIVAALTDAAEALEAVDAEVAG